MSKTVQRFAGLLQGFFIFILCAFLLTACDGGSVSSMKGDPGTFNATGTATSSAQPVGGAAAANAQKIFAANTLSPGDGNNEDYKIAPLDVIEITVFGVTELNRTAQVGTTGP